MKKIIITILLITAFVEGSFIFYQYWTTKQNKQAVNQTNQQAGAQPTWPAKMDDQASVTITVAPIDVSPQAQEWGFDISMNTHSVELDQDMLQSTVLIDDQGRKYKPLSWEGPIGGHHRQGVLIFKQIIPIPKTIELKISNVGGVIRSFVWQTK